MPPSSNNNVKGPEKPSHIPILDYARVVAGTLKDLAVTTHVPFLGTVDASSLIIFKAIESTKVNKDLYMCLVDQIHAIHCAIINICFVKDYFIPIQF
ncbi:hypothetical protein B0H10DRAFT_2223230 [Mycena sp. CBHHK59/15]|nr:hypothetical protein B0H10DRAFT_2223230 [Mycena sp. CBHHK59/15]